MAKEYEQAEGEIPHAVYEDFVFLYGVGILTFGLIRVARDVGEDMPVFALSVASAATYIIGSIMDTCSTVKGLKVIQRADELGINHPLEELNDYFPGRPTVEEYWQSIKKKGISVDAVGAFVAATCPAVGLGRGFVALNNSRKARRLSRAIEIATR
jgi:hypothetical protein